MFSKWVVCILSLFTIFGLHPELPDMAIQRKISRIVFVIHIGFSIFSTFYLAEIGLWLLWTGRKTQLVNEVFEYLFALIANWTFIIESCVKRKHQYRFWQLLQDINLRFAHRNITVSKTYLIKFFEYYAYYVLIIVLECTSFPQFNNIFLVIRIIGLFAIHRIFYYIFYLELIVFKLKTIEIGTKKMIASCNSEGFSEAHRNIFRFQQNSFLWLREYYQLVHRLIENINSNFGWSIAISIPYTFTSLLSQMNWRWSYRESISNNILVNGVN